jgi:transposase
VIDPDGRRRKPWIFRIVLSYSRIAYSEAVWRQTTETFIRCLENAFRYFGGVSKSLNLDNLKAAVIKADWYEPEFNPKLESFCQHYGTCLMPCRPKKAEHKELVSYCA